MTEDKRMGGIIIERETSSVVWKYLRAAERPMFFLLDHQSERLHGDAIGGPDKPKFRHVDAGVSHVKALALFLKIFVTIGAFLTHCNLLRVVVRIMDREAPSISCSPTVEESLGRNHWSD